MMAGMGQLAHQNGSGIVGRTISGDERIEEKCLVCVLLHLEVPILIQNDVGIKKPIRKLPKLTRYQSDQRRAINSDPRHFDCFLIGRVYVKATARPLLPR